MKRIMIAHCAVAFSILAGCDNQPQGSEPSQAANAAAPAENQVATIDPADLPPAIVDSPSYRCDDRKALYVDVLQDKQAVLVRNSRADTPTRLDREGDSGPFTSDGVSLSGTGTEVRYASPDRPSQVCRRAAE